MCCLFLFADKHCITLPNYDRDLLIHRDSFSHNPLALVYLTLSDPAKSTKFNIPVVNLFYYLLYFSTISLNMA